jgi:hypothetical protein
MPHIVDADKLNAVAANARSALSSTAASMQQRSKQRTADARQQQAQEQQEQQQQLEQGIKQLKERGLQVLRAGLDVPASSRAAPGLQKAGVLQALSAEQVAAEIASRAERLKARLAAASLLVQEAAGAIAAGADVLTVAGCSEARDDAGSGHGSASSSCDVAGFSSDDDDEAASLQEQRKCSTAAGLQKQHTNSSAAADDGTTASGSDSSMASDLEGLVAGIFRPSLLPDWTYTNEPAGLNKDGSCSTALGESEGEDEVFTSMFKVSLPPGL